MEEIIEEEISPAELRIKRAGLGIASAMLVAGGVIAGTETLLHVLENLPPYSPADDFNGLTHMVGDAKALAHLTLDSLTVWMGLEFGDLAARSHRRLQEVTASPQH